MVEGTVEAAVAKKVRSLAGHLVISYRDAEVNSRKFVEVKLADGSTQLLTLEEFAAL